MGCAPSSTPRRQSEPSLKSYAVRAAADPPDTDDSFDVPGEQLPPRKGPSSFYRGCTAFEIQKQEQEQHDDLGTTLVRRRRSTQAFVETDDIESWDVVGDEDNVYFELRYPGALRGWRREDRDIGDAVRAIVLIHTRTSATVHILLGRCHQERRGRVVSSSPLGDLYNQRCESDAKCDEHDSDAATAVRDIHSCEYR
eukprot:PhM_4_TR395/c0_g1_i2/m.49650